MQTRIRRQVDDLPFCSSAGVTGVECEGAEQEARGREEGGSAGEGVGVGVGVGVDCFWSPSPAESASSAAEADPAGTA